jgi:KRAB domain-containing zinc finger protein/PAX-interacting protein 1
MNGVKNISARGYLQQGRASGYTEESAHKEHSDNSEDAGAQNVSFFFTGDMATRKCYTLDDGYGMTPSGLDCSLQWAGTRPDREHTDIGKFGLGMKTAALNLGNKCIVLTKTSDGVVSGAYLDFEDMERNDYLNHKTIANPLEDNLVKAYVCPFIIERFNNQVSGTLIVTWELLRNNIKKTADACSMLLKDLAVSYLNKRVAINVIHFNGNGIITEDKVPQVDPFYRDNNSALQKPRVETELFIYQNDDNSYKIIEKSTSIRPMGGNKNTCGTTVVSKYYLFHSEKRSNKWVEISSHQLPKGPYSIVKLNVIFIKDAAYENEQFIKDTRIADRNGFYFRRGKRYVAYGQRLGVSMNMELNRMRCEVSFGSDLDHEMGLTFNKNMGVPCDAIKNSLVSIWKDITGPWVKEVKEERKDSQAEVPESTPRATQERTLLNFIQPQVPTQPASSQRVVVQEKVVQEEIVQEEVVQEEAVQDEVVQDEVVVQEEVVHEETVHEEVVVQEVVQDEVVVQEEVVQDEVVTQEGIPESREVRHRTGPVSQDIKAGLEFINIADGRLRVNKNGVKLREFSVYGKGSVWLEIFNKEKEIYGDDGVEKLVIAVCNSRGDN